MTTNRPKHEPKILILGCGAIGGILAGSLTHAGRDVTAVDPWFQHVETMRTHGLTITGPEEQLTTRIHALHLDELDQLQRPADVLVLSPKSYDTEWMARFSRAYLADDAVVIAAQNGITEERLPEWLPDHRLLGCVVRTAGELTAPGRVVRHLGRGWPAMTLGDLTGRVGADGLAWLVELFSPAGEIRTTDNAWGELWSKLSHNITASPAGGITGHTTRVCWSDPTLVEVAIAMAGECITVAETLGHRVEPIFGHFDPSLFRRAHEGDETARQDAIASIGQMAAQRIGKRENAPSLVHDIRKGRRTEIDHLSGHVVRHGQALGVPTPTNTAMTAMVHEVESGRLAQGPQNVERIGALRPSPSADAL